MVTNLLDLSNELLALICGFAMVYKPALHNGQNHCPSGLIADQLSNKLRQLLRPMRSCHRLYMIARRQFLEVNVVALDHSHPRMSACRLEHQPSTGQILYTGNPDPLLERLVHVQVCIQILGTRTQSFLPGEEASLRELVTLCRNLKTLHVFFKVDFWTPNEKDVHTQSTMLHQINERENRFREQVHTIIGLLRDLPVRMATVAVHEWSDDVNMIMRRDLEPSEAVDALLHRGGYSEGGNRHSGPIVRVRTAPVKHGTVAERKVKLSWGASDDVVR